MDVTVHAVTSRPGQLARARLGANVQRSANAGFSTTHPPDRANARPSASSRSASAGSFGSLWGGWKARRRLDRQPNRAMRYGHATRIHAGVMLGGASRWLKASGSAEAARPLMFVSKDGVIGLPACG